MERAPHGISRRSVLGGAAGLLALGVSRRPTTALAAVERPSSTTSHHWVRRSGTSLRLNGNAFRFAGANLYWLGLDDNIRDADGNPTYPTKYQAFQGITAAAQMGSRVIRAHTLGISVGQPYSVMPALGEFNDAAFAPIDYAIATAAAAGIRLMVPLTDQWRYYHGGKWVFCHWRADELGVDTNPDLDQNCGNDATELAVESNFYTNPTVIDDFLGYVTHVMDHVNPLTGLALKDDPTIAIWQTGNELWDATPQWTAVVANTIKSLSPHSLVADGSAADGLAVADMPGLQVPAVDIVGSHYYPPSTNQVAADLAAATAANKAFVTDEYDWTGLNGGPDLADWLDQLSSSDAAGDVFWTLLPYDPDGEPEPHDDGYEMWNPPVGQAMATAISTIEAHAQLMANQPTQAAKPKDRQRQDHLRKKLRKLRHEDHRLHARRHTVERRLHQPRMADGAHQPQQQHLRARRRQIDRKLHEHHRDERRIRRRQRS